jgi:hypothetical protein
MNYVEFREMLERDLSRDTPDDLRAVLRALYIQGQKPE